LWLHPLHYFSGKQASPPLRLEKTIELPDVQGRIDHLCIDIKRGGLFVAALGNNIVEIIDLNAGRRIKTISKLNEPQGVLYVPEMNRLYVANGNEGTVRSFDAKSHSRQTSETLVLCRNGKGINFHKSDVLMTSIYI
jgi:hypothetical protein